jgi:hypothetical protein
MHALLFSVRHLAVHTSMCSVPACQLTTPTHMHVLTMHTHIPMYATWSRVGGSTASLVELYGRLLASPHFRAWFALARVPLAHLIAVPGAPAGVPGQQASTQQQGDAAGGGGGLAWFSKARQHLDEVNLINLFYAVEGQLRDAVAEAGEADAPDDAEETVARWVEFGIGMVLLHWV